VFVHSVWLKSFTGPQRIELKLIGKTRHFRVKASGALRIAGASTITADISNNRFFTPIPFVHIAIILANTIVYTSSAMLNLDNINKESMMKRSLWLCAALLLGSTSALAAPDSCERVKNDIQQKIINNGVPESGFTSDCAQRSTRSARRPGGRPLRQRHL
jgi:predicted small secreted protein